MYRIFLVEDDLALAGAVRKHLESYGLQVICAADFTDVAGEFAACRPQLVLMDIKLPYRDGYYWCSRIREVSAVPVVFLSSAADNMNIVMAMNMGGDDFIAKPFDLDVLMAKVQALLRRAYDFGESVPVLEHRGALLNTGDGTLRFGERTLTLSRNEFRILLCLLENKGRAVSRERLMERLWQTDQFVDENTLTVNVNRLRKKLDALGLPDFIATRFGVGYLVE